MKANHKSMPAMGVMSTKKVAMPSALPGGKKVTLPSSGDTGSKIKAAMKMPKSGY